MQVIILCGGYGTRLREETEFKPKPMVFIGKKPIIWHIMKIYAYYGINEFILALGYKANNIKDYFLNQKAFTTDFILHTRSHKTKYFLENRTEIDDFKITFVDTGLDTLPGERILRCENYISKKDKHFMVTYGDGVADINLKNLINFHNKQKTIGTIIGVHLRSKFGLMNVNTKNLVTNFNEKPVLTDWVNGGYMVFNREAFKYFRNGESEHPALKRLAKKRELSFFKHTGFWFAVDTIKELTELNQMWTIGNCPWKVWK
ncbi:MAG: Glucose-1-phosphate cytidylyltransferase [Candidatus Gottesmanbacteria bacterium GW2011_GWA1_34_13]|uniref:Glucose-1-phosphate cytidylyltransferase n=1 Tax=Candidatus Gottesmanbacteria bacterium GW2011_GWA1_34_13 TaxID=1618434 RepID=A0A0G0D9E4_9BACT|nr:MAG: Glucose-1-phosphate cytidylyltransferase [Candidatus Gottesmanbacteria bacterium GW2011_GWA1_34_13]